MISKLPNCIGSVRYGPDTIIQQLIFKIYNKQLKSTEKYFIYCFVITLKMLLVNKTAE